MRYTEINDFTKVQNIIKAVEGSDLIGREFTKKDFDKVCKGISSLEWVRENGICPRDNKVSSMHAWRNTTIPFVKLVRVEHFELPYKPTDYVCEEDIPYVNGEKCADIDARKFAYDEDYRKMCIKAYGEVEIRREKPTTFTASRNFYTIDLDLLKSATLNVKFVKAYYDEKIAECERKLAKYKACANALA